MWRISWTLSWSLTLTNPTWSRFSMELNCIQTWTIHSANTQTPTMAPSVRHLHTQATKSSLPTSAMHRMAVSDKCALLFPGSTDTSIHAQASPALSQNLCHHAYAMSNMEAKVRFATCPNKQTCRCKNPVEGIFLPLRR